MLKFRISLANEPGETYEVDGFEAVLGRAPTCDVVVAQKHITVSGKHARVMAGIVVLDLGSANGTFVSAQNVANGNQVTKGQIAGAAVAPNGEFTIGNSVHVNVECDAVGPMAGSMEGAMGGATIPPPMAGGAESDRIIELDRALSDERQRNEALNRQMQEALAQASSISEETILNHPLVQQIIEERDDLRRRLDSSRAEVDSLRTNAGSSVEAQNAMNEAEGARRRSEELQAEVTDLRKRVDELLDENRRVAAAAGNPADMGDSPTDLPGAQHGAAGSLQAEVQRLTAENAQLAHAASEAQAQTGSPSEVFKKLNEEIRRLNGELKAASSKTATRGSAPAADSRPAQTKPVMVGGGLAILKKIADADVDAVPQDLERPVDQFFYAEMFRFARTSEQLLTDVVCKALELIGGSTMMPGHDRTLRPLTAAIIENPTEYGPRREFASYVKELQRWMLIGTQIFPEAANKFAVELRDSISETALTAGNPIPRMLKISGGTDGELWRRTQKLLSDQSGEVIRDRISALARDSAERMHPSR